MKKWDEYYKRAGEKPNQLVAGVLEENVSGRTASLDLGAGNLRDSKFLLEQGFSRVVAVDCSEQSRDFAVDGIELHIEPIQTYGIEKNTYDYIVCCNTLFFLKPNEVVDLFNGVFDGLRAGGVFTGNVLGKEDEWVLNGAPVSSFTGGALEILLSRFKMIDLGDVKYHAPSNPPKFWHLWSFVVQKV